LLILSYFCAVTRFYEKDKTRTHKQNNDKNAKTKKQISRLNFFLIYTVFIFRDNNRTAMQLDFYLHDCVNNMKIKGMYN